MTKNDDLPTNNFQFVMRWIYAVGASLATFFLLLVLLEPGIAVAITEFIHLRACR